MNIMRSGIESIQQGKQNVAKYAAMLSMVLMWHMAQAQTPHDNNDAHHTQDTTTTHVVSSEPHTDTHTSHAPHPYGAVQWHVRYWKEHVHLGGQFIMGMYGNRELNPMNKLGYNMAFWPMGWAEIYPELENGQINPRQLIYNANMSWTHNKAGTFEVGRFGTIPYLPVTTFRPVMEEERLKPDEPELRHVAHGYTWLAYSHPRVKWLTAWGGDVARRQGDLNIVGWLAYHKDFGGAKLDALTYAGGRDITIVLNRWEDYAVKKPRQNRFGTDVMFATRAPYKPYSMVQKTIEEVDSTGNIVQTTVYEKEHNSLDVSAHFLASYARDFSPRVSAIVKWSGEVVATFTWDETEIEANGRVSGAVTWKPKKLDGTAVTFGIYGKVNQDLHPEIWGGVTLTLGHGHY